MISLYMTAHITSEDDLFQVQARSLEKLYSEWKSDGVSIARSRTIRISTTIYNKTTPNRNYTIFFIRKFSTIDSTVSSKSTEGSCTEIKTSQQVGEISRFNTTQRDDICSSVAWKCQNMEYGTNSNVQP